MRYRILHQSASATSKQVSGILTRETVFNMRQIKLFLLEVNISSTAVVTPLIER